MKKLLSAFIMMAVIVCMITATAITASAAEIATQDGIEVSIATDRDSYTSTDDINVTVSVKNTNTYDVNDVDVTVELPEGLSLKSGELSVNDIDIKAGETYTKNVIAVKATSSSEEQKQEDNPTKTEEDNKQTSPQTGDDSNLILWIILLVFSVAGIVLSFKYRKKATKVLSLFLCVAMLAAVVPLGAIAAQDDTVALTANKSIFIDAKEYSISTTIKFYKNNTLSSFSADETYFVCGEESQITFTVSANAGKSDIDLYMEDENVGQMHDDGLNGDLIANDGIYTYVLVKTVVSKDLKTYRCYCSSNEKVSNDICIYFFPILTEESSKKAKNDYETVQNQINIIEQKFYDETGGVPNDKKNTLINEILKKLDEYKENGIILHYYFEEDNIYVKFPSGLGSIYNPSQINTDGTGNDVSMTVITCQPCYTDMGGASYSGNCYQLPEGVNYVLEMLDDVAVDINNCFDNYKFSNITNYDDSQVTLDLINSFGENQIILWHGHGYYGPVVKSSLVTGETFDWNAYYWNIPYFNNCVTNRFVNSLVNEFDTVIITSKYIDHYCKNMNGSFVYLAACCSGKTPELANSFLSKGAYAVVANSETIIRDYNVAMLYETLSNMLSINENTNNYYTLDESLHKAKGLYGNDDSDPRYKGMGATPLIFGGATANNFRLSNAYGSLSGKICKASDRLTAIPGATIKVFKDNNLYATKNADNYGNYSIELPAGDYYVTISADGYIDFNSYATVIANENTYMETFLMIKDSTDGMGYASGKVTNSIAGVGVDGVTLTVRKDWNNTNSGATTVATATTTSDGAYLLELPLGNYTVVASKDGYLTSTFNIIVQSGTTGNQNGIITPIVSGNEFLITLTWDENPRDLDSHVEGTLSGGSKFHVYYSHKSQYDGDIEVCNLDYDDTDSYGPEHITLHTTNDSPYYYYIYKYAGNGTVANSEAKITVHQGNTLIAQFNVPTNLGDNDYWNVFAIKGGQLIVKNSITSTQDISYADTVN